MTKFDLALARIARLPPERQEAVAVLLEELLDDEEAGSEPPAWHLEEVRARQAGPDDFATDAEAEAFLKRHGG